MRNAVCEIDAMEEFSLQAARTSAIAKPRVTFLNQRDQAVPLSEAGTESEAWSALHK